MIEIVATKIVGGHRLSFANGNVIGDALTTETGYVGLWLEEGSGYVDAPVLRAIADKLDELDKPWVDVVNAYSEGETE